MVGRRSFPFEDDFLAGAMLVSGSVYVCPWAICSPTLRPYPNPLRPYQKSATAWMILGIRPTIRKCVILFPLDSLLRMGMFVSYCWWFRNHANQLRLVVYPIIYKVFYIPGFLPSTVGLQWPCPSPHDRRRRTKNSVPTWSAQSLEGVPVCKPPRWACVQTSNRGTPRRVSLKKFMRRSGTGVWSVIFAVCNTYWN